MRIDRLSVSPWRLLAAGIFALSLSPGATAAPLSTTSTCTETATRVPAPPRALALATAAQTEHRAFGSQTMDAEGRLVASGQSEAEDTRGSSMRARAPWQRVLGYWRATEPQGETLPYLVGFGAWRPAHRHLLKQALNQATAAHLRGLGAGPDQGLDSSELLAVETALDRVAVMDTPWSAAFIGWLARQAGLTTGEFVFSEAHADYAGGALQAGIDEAAGRATRYALRACDLMRTPPRVGDLVCHARAAGAGLDTFDKLGEVLSTRSTGGGALPMHCDAVVSVDASGFDTVGGNVLQSVPRGASISRPARRCSTRAI